MCIRDLNSEFAKLESADNVASAQAAAATSHKDWRDITSVDVSVQKGLSNLFSSGRVEKEKREMENEKRLKAHGAFQKYYEQGEPRLCGHQSNLMEIFQI
jgi:hypothetical protein